MSKKIKALDPKLLCTRCSPAQFRFKTTEELISDEDMVGQERAIESIQYGLDMNLKGYNIFVMGQPGVGKHTLAKKLVIRKSRLRSAAADWCYVFNYTNPLKPKVLKLQPGVGSQLRDDMDKLIEIFHNDFSVPMAERLIADLKHKYQEHSNIVVYFDDTLANIIKNPQEFTNQTRDHLTLFDQPHIETPPFSRLKINVFVDNSKTIGSPVIYEDNAIYHNLVGRVENMSINGSLISDFTLIKPGSLHRANHGYLILDAYEVLNHHLAWEGLKRALHTEQVRIEPLEQSIEFWSSQTLEPEPIPLDIKIVVIGDRDTYHMLCEEQPDFKELFKVVADFNNKMPRNKKNSQRFAEVIAKIAREENLKPLTPGAVAGILDFSSRNAEDAEKLSLHMHTLKDITQQANYWATLSNKTLIDRISVKKAISTEKKRLNRLQDEVFEDMLRNIIAIDTDGKKIGQINALTVVEEGSYVFGQPSRITAVTHVGDGDVINIQREIDLSGSIHSKGVLTLSGFLKKRYAVTEKLSLSASIAFEQLYTVIDGDSASAAELCALLSALSQVPIKQSLAVTGSINQFGELQAISGVNEKIEGFFRLCKSRNLTGKQGVIIPAINMKNLMLNDELIRAANNNQFHIYPANNVDEVMHLLTDVEPGKQSKNGEFKKDSINYKIEYRLLNYAKFIKKNQG